MMRKGDKVTKVEVATAMYELIHEESREVIIQAFIEGAWLTPKSAQGYGDTLLKTYFRHFRPASLGARLKSVHLRHLHRALRIASRLSA